MLKIKEIRELSSDDRLKRLDELRHELMQERGIQAMGGSTPNPGKIRTIRRQIARILTVEKELQG